MSKKVFMSYSWRDSNVASRIYNDLIRSQVTIWRDKIDGDPIEDFQKEFLSKIDECDYFLLLDSTNYRMKSKWCYTELSRCFENQKKRNSPKIIVCLLEPDGEWRTNFTNQKQQELFSLINRLKYHFFYFDGYDNKSTYKESITNICNILDLSFIPWGNMPSHQDLLDELFHGQSHELDNEDIDAVVNEYKIILNKINKERYFNIKEHFLLWIEDCKQNNLKLYFPEWTCAIWLANNSKEDLQESEKILKNLIITYPDDPRAYRGLGCIYASTDKYDEALETLLKAYDLIHLEKNIQHKKYCEFELLFNIAQLLINVGRFFDAISYLNSAYIIMKEDGFININLIKNIEFVNTELKIGIKQRIDFIKSVITNFPLEEELYKLLGFCYVENGNHYSAYIAFKTSYFLSPSVETSFHLLCQMSNLDLKEEYNQLISTVFLTHSDSNEDNYWKGAIAYFIESDINKALLYYNKCNDSQFNWYGEI